MTGSKIGASKIGPYELLGSLGAGGMAETYLAKKVGPARFEQRVCLKRMLPSLASDAELTALFLQEAQLAARLRHGNIAQVLDFGEHEGNYYLVLELVEGTDLRLLLRGLKRTGEELTTGLVAYIAVSIASGLERAHDEGIVHRDISPSNILLSNAGEVKVADFGVARRIASDKTRTGSVKGKVPYMAPEYAREGRVHPGIDLFSLGVTLFEALAGRRPFDGRNDIETLENIAKGSRPALLDLAPSVPVELAHVVDCLLELDPDVRFTSTRELRQALGAVTPPPTARRILAKLVRAHARPTPENDLVFDETKPATPGGTMQLGDRPERQEQPRSAGPTDETRTRLPDVQTEVAPDPPTAVETRTTLDATTDPASARADHPTPAPPPPTAIYIAAAILALATAAALTWLLLS